MHAASAREMFYWHGLNNCTKSNFQKLLFSRLMFRQGRFLGYYVSPSLETQCFAKCANLISGIFFLSDIDFSDFHQNFEWENVISWNHEKTCKIRARSPMTFCREFFYHFFAQPNGPTSTIKKRAQNPIYVELMSSKHFFRVGSFLNMFCHTGFTESYEW